MRLRRVVDSPPGITSPSRPSSSSGFRTSTTSTAGPPSSVQRWSALTCRAKSPCSARTPIFRTATSVLPAAGRQPILVGHLRDLEAHHGFAEVFAHPREDVGILVVRRRLHDGLRALRRILGLEKAGADEHRFGADD